MYSVLIQAKASPNTHVLLSQYIFHWVYPNAVHITGHKVAATWLVNHVWSPRFAIDTCRATVTAQLQLLRH